MDCHLYGSKTFYDLASPITDVWLPDLRYGNDKCAKTLSGVDNYLKYAKLGLDAMAQHDSKIIVRILVLPGHVSCCHEPEMELLSEYRDRIWVSVLDQYVPEHEAHLDPNLKRRPTKEEIKAVNSLVERRGLRNILAGSKDFWGF
jgi:putative pyruvate formate lyase activating enzyme